MPALLIVNVPAPMARLLPIVMVEPVPLTVTAPDEPTLAPIVRLPKKPSFESLPPARMLSFPEPELPTYSDELIDKVDDVPLIVRLPVLPAL